MAQTRGTLSRVRSYLKKLHAWNPDTSRLELWNTDDQVRVAEWVPDTVDDRIEELAAEIFEAAQDVSDQAGHMVNTQVRRWLKREGEEGEFKTHYSMRLAPADVDTAASKMDATVYGQVQQQMAHTEKLLALVTGTVDKTVGQLAAALARSEATVKRLSDMQEKAFEERVQIMELYSEVIARGSEQERDAVEAEAASRRADKMVDSLSTVLVPVLTKKVMEGLTEQKAVTPAKKGGRNGPS